MGAKVRKIIETNKHQKELSVKRIKSGKLTRESAA